MAIVELNNCFTDGIQAVTGCTFGNNALIFRDLGKTAVTVARREDGQAVRLMVRPDYRPKMMARYPAAGPLFKKIVVERQGTPEELHRFHHLWEVISRRELQTPLEEQLHIQHLTISMPEYARIFESLICGACGEQVMASRVGAGRADPLPGLRRGQGSRAQRPGDRSGVHLAATFKGRHLGSDPARLPPWPPYKRPGQKAARPGH